MSDLGPWARKPAKIAVPRLSKTEKRLAQLRRERTHQIRVPAGALVEHYEVDPESGQQTSPTVSGTLLADLVIEAELRPAFGTYRCRLGNRVVVIIASDAIRV